jgi:hypothetical protein
MVTAAFAVVAFCIFVQGLTMTPLPRIPGRLDSAAVASTEDESRACNRDSRHRDHRVLKRATVQNLTDPPGDHGSCGAGMYSFSSSPSVWVFKLILLAASIDSQRVNRGFTKCIGKRGDALQLDRSTRKQRARTKSIELLCTRQPRNTGAMDVQRENWCWHGPGQQESCLVHFEPRHLQ